MTTLVQHTNDWLADVLHQIAVRCGASVVDFGEVPVLTASVMVNVAISGISPKVGCVLAQIALRETAALGDSPGRTLQEHIDHAPHMTVLCGTPDAQGMVQIVVSSSVARTGRYAINIQRIV